MVTKLLYLRYNSELTLYDFQAQWRGFSHKALTCEPFYILQEYILQMLQNFTSYFPYYEMVERAQDF